MLLTLEALEWYGPGCAAGVDTSVPSASASMRADGRLGSVDTSVATSPLAKATMGKYMHAFDQSAGSSPLAALRANARLGAIGKVNELTQDDVSGAVWEIEVEPGKSFRQAMLDLLAGGSVWTEVIESGYTAAEIMRLLAAVAQGSATGLEGSSPVFKSIDGAKDRITATYSGGTRTVTGRDAT